VKTKNTRKSTGQEKPLKSGSPGPSSANSGKKQAKPLFSKELLIKLLPLIKAFVLWFALVAIVHIPGIKQDFRDIIVGFTTWSTVTMGKLLFLPVTRLGYSTFNVDGFTMEIIVECTAYNFYLFAIALSAFANWSTKRKAINLMIFIVIIFLTNNLRFFAMGYIGRHYPTLFDTTHDYIWNILFGFMIFGVWAWRDKIDNPDFQPKEDES
jgi:exosortase/archaeosortase family protein